MVKNQCLLPPLAFSHSDREDTELRLRYYRENRPINSNLKRNFPDNQKTPQYELLLCGISTNVLKAVQYTRKTKMKRQQQSSPPGHKNISTYLSYFCSATGCGYCIRQPAFHILVVSFQDSKRNYTWLLNSFQMNNSTLCAIKLHINKKHDPKFYPGISSGQN